VTAGVHRNARGGIQGSGVPGQGAESVLVSRRYEDDVDLGTTIFYTGQGGQDPNTGLVHRPQVADQVWAGLNKTLGENAVSGQPVRVIRNDPSGYRYDGLFQVLTVRDLRGISGHRIFRYELSQLPTPTTPGRPAKKLKKGPAPRKLVEPTDRIVRDTTITRAIKTLYD
jgi:putative restriction endonuclease